ncbi:TIR domain-containing protein [Cupriavidus nantongensis]|uniref:TIR domain-containing protein n=1 Tax=Cupriavidus nantongensis TaxID=1796606 RepID=UPI00358F2F38
MAIATKKAPAKKAAAKKSAPKAAKTAEKTRSYMSQEDIPAFSIDEALVVAQVIFAEYGGGPSTPLDVAAGLEMQTTNTKFRMLCGASIAYGLTTGGYNAASVSVTDLARRICKPMEEGDDLVAKREAVLKPRIIREFLSKYSGSQLPRDKIAEHVLEQMKVPEDRTKQVFDMIMTTADSVGFIRTIKDKKYADLVGTRPPGSDEALAADEGTPATTIAARAATIPEPIHGEAAIVIPVTQAASAATDGRMRKVFITHGKNTTFIDPIKELLAFGELIPVVSVEKQSVAQPVPDKVMNDMRGCAAAIIHVDGEQKLMDPAGGEVTTVNSNVLIEIGAAMALYGRRFILLVKDGVKLPSNLQGLYEVRYQGDALDGGTTIKLMKAINEMKNTPMPTAE